MEFLKLVQGTEDNGYQKKIDTDFILNAYKNMV